MRSPRREEDSSLRGKVFVDKWSPCREMEPSLIRGDLEQSPLWEVKLSSRAKSSPSGRVLVENSNPRREAESSPRGRVLVEKRSPHL